MLLGDIGHKLNTPHGQRGKKEKKTKIFFKMEKTNGQILGTDTSQNEQNKIKIVPKNTIISLSTDNFNSLVHYSKHQALLKQISDTVKDGDCLFDTCYQGIRLHNDLALQSKVNSAKQLWTTWAAQNLNCSTWQTNYVLRSSP